MLTFKMKELLNFITAYQHANRGVSPNYREMAAAIRLRSTSNIARLLDEMEHEKAVRRLRNRVRAVEVLKRAE